MEKLRGLIEEKKGINGRINGFKGRVGDIETKSNEAILEYAKGNLDDTELNTILQAIGDTNVVEKAIVMNERMLNAKNKELDKYADKVKTNILDLLKREELVVKADETLGEVKDLALKNAEVFIKITGITLKAYKEAKLSKADKEMIEMFTAIPQYMYIKQEARGIVSKIVREYKEQAKMKVKGL